MRKYKHLIIALADLFIIYLAFLMALFIYDKFHYINANYVVLHHELPVILTVTYLFYETFGMYKGLWKFASIEELVRGVGSTTISLVVAFFINMWIGQMHFDLVYML